MTPSLYFQLLCLLALLLLSLFSEVFNTKDDQAAPQCVFSDEGRVRRSTAGQCGKKRWCQEKSVVPAASSSQFFAQGPELVPSTAVFPRT